MSGKTARDRRRKPDAAGRPVTGRAIVPLGLAAGLVAVFLAYGPVMRGPFIFDDDYLPFRLQNFSESLSSWIRGNRPLLMLTYWVNFRSSPADDTLSYHLLNVLFHYGAAVMIFLALRRLLALAELKDMRRTGLAAFGAALFLLHPVQTEAVAYVASRSENLSVLLFFAAYAVFLCRPAEAISWPRVFLVFLLTGAAVGVKEHTLVLPALLLLTDYYWNPGFTFRGIRRNWRLYAPLAALAVAGAFYIHRVLAAAATAGFGMKDLRWYEYFFTQWRALFVYLRLMVLPVGQSADYDFPISRTVFDHGAVFGLVALAAISVAAWVFRRRYPLASFGWFAFLLLMAPTSSIMPIKDPLAERRLYLSMFGLLLIAIDFLRRLRVPAPALAAGGAALLLVSGALAYQRNLVWSDRIALWQDTIRTAPRNARAHFQLAYSYYEDGRCAEALPHYQRVLEIRGPDYNLLVDWALAHQCLGQTAEAIAKLRQAAALERTAHVYSMIAMVYANSQQWQEALNALDEAQRIDSNYAMIYVYRGGIRLAQNDPATAEAEYRRALAIEPANEPARSGLAQAQRLRTVR